MRCCFSHWPESARNQSSKRGLIVLEGDETLVATNRGSPAWVLVAFSREGVSSLLHSKFARTQDVQCTQDSLEYQGGNEFSSIQIHLVGGDGGRRWEL